MAYALTGRVPDAVSLLTRAVEQSAMMGRVHHETLCRLALGKTHLLSGCLEEAYTYAARALALAREHQERGHEAYALHLLGGIAMHRKPPDIKQAETFYQQPLALSDELGMRPLQAHCHRGLGILYSQTGQAEQARAELSTAIDMYREMEMTFWLPETEAALAAVEGKA